MLLINPSRPSFLFIMLQLLNLTSTRPWMLFQFQKKFFQFFDSLRGFLV